MGTPLPIALATKSSPARNGQEGAAKLINCFAEETPDGKNPFAIYACSGLTSLATVASTGVTRGMIAVDANLYAVMGRSVVRFDGGFGSEIIGGIAGDGVLTMAQNRKEPNPQIMVVCPGAVSIIENEVITPVTDPDLPSPISCAQLDGYFILFIADGRFYITSIDEGTEIDALDFATAEANPDGGRRNAVRNRDAVFFGNKSTEFWQNTGAADFPFSRVTTIDVGLYAESSVAEMTLIQKSGPAEDTLIWAAANRDGAYCGVMMLSGYTPVKISSYEIDRLIEAETDPTDIQAFSWSENGHSFYCISGPTWTRSFDATEGQWHSRESVGESRWRGNCYARFAGKHVIGDFEAGEIYQMSSSIYDEDGEELVMTIQCPPAHAFPHGLTWNEITLDMVRGVGLNSTSEYLANPVVIVDYSDDGGKTFGPERHIEIGRTAQIGKTIRRSMFGRTIRGAARTWRIRVSAAVFRCVMSFNADVEKDAA